MMPHIGREKSPHEYNLFPFVDLADVSDLLSTQPTRGGGNDEQHIMHQWQDNTDHIENVCGSQATVQAEFLRTAGSADQK